MAALVVSVHDVSPLTEAACDQMLAELVGVGVSRASLLVIPDHHGRAPVVRAPGFQRWLSRKVSEGHEPVLHGYRHLRTRRVGENARTRWITRVYTAGEGEFYDVTEGEAAALLSQGRRDLSFLSRTPAGFIAPAWLLGPEARRAVTAGGFRYTTTVNGVDRLPDEARTPSRSLVWSTRSLWRRAASRLWNAGLHERLRREPLLRIGLHPPDVCHAAVWDQALGIVRAAVRDREVMTYEEWVAKGG